MATYPYVATLAVDPVTLVKAAGATGQIYAPADTGFTSPLTATDATGNPIALTANTDGILPSFYSAEPAVNWASGFYVFPLVTSQPLPGPPGQPGERGTDGSNVVPTAEAIATELGTKGTPAETVLSATILAETSPLTAVAYSGSLGSRVVTLGDSITIGSSGFTSASESISTAWPAYAGWQSGQKFRVVRNAGIGGNTSAQMLARFDTDVTPYEPTLVTIGAGTNDMGQNVPFADWKATMLAIIAKVQAIGAKPVLLTIPPRNDTGGYGVRVTTWNMWLREHALRNGYPLVDMNGVLTDPTNGQYKTAYSSGDGVHPSKAGYAAMGSLTVSTLSPLLSSSVTPLPTWNGDPSNRFGNGLFLTDTNPVDGIGDGWSKYGSGTWTPSLEPAPVGNWQKFDVTAGNTGIYRATTGTFTAGDRVRFVGKFDTTGGGFQAQVNVTGTSYYYRAVHGVDNAVNGTWDVEFTIPTGGTGATLTIVGNTGIHKVAQVGLYNLTSMGL